jgi:hypothetical protein
MLTILIHHFFPGLFFILLYPVLAWRFWADTRNDEVDELDELDEPLGDHMTPHIQALRQACANGRPESEDVMPLVDAIRYAYLNPPIGRTRGYDEF